MKTKSKGIALAIAIALGSVALGGCSSSATTGHTASKDIVIGFSQSYTGNPWRQAEDKAFNDAAAKLKKAGQIKGTIFLDANQSQSTQISQINDLVLKHVSVIIIDPISSTALNGAIASAVHAGIPVLVTTDGPVTSKLAYQINGNNFQIYSQQAKYIAKRLNGRGNMLNVRGIAGSQQDKNLNDAFQSVFKSYPNLKTVSQVYGNWTASVTQSGIAGVIATLPPIQAVYNQGAGEEYGAVKALQAAGRPVPLIVGGNSGQFIQWWIQQYKKTGYTTESSCGNPGVGQIDAYLGMWLAQGKHVPKNMTIPGLLITQSNLMQYKDLAPNGQASKTYSLSWIKKNVLSQ